MTESFTISHDLGPLGNDGYIRFELFHVSYGRCCPHLRGGWYLRCGWLKRKTSVGVFRICFGGIFFLVGLSVTMGILHSPRPQENRTQDREILGLKAEDVQSIILDRVFKNLAVDQTINLVQKPITLTKRSEVAAICAALGSAKIMSPNHPAAQWECAVRFNTKTHPLDMVVSSTGNQGVILWLNESYRSAAMGTALEAIAKDHDFGKLTPAEAAARQRKSDCDDLICVKVLLSVVAVGFVFVFLVLPIFPMWRICRRLGLSPIPALLMLLPIVNVALLFIIGFQKLK